jgi:anti-sigma B factor antagonist
MGASDHPSGDSHRFRITVSDMSPDISLVTVAGDVDLHSAPELRDRLFELVDGDVTRIVLDLSDATFLDSMGLGVVLGTKKRLAAKGGELELVVANPDIRRIFEITMLDRIFELHSSRDVALAGGDGGSSYRAASTDG